MLKIFCFKVSKLTEDYERLNSNYEVMRDKISELTAALETQRSQNVVMEKELKVTLYKADITLFILFVTFFIIRGYI